MQNRPQGLRTITQDELVQFILRHGIDKESNKFYFPPRFPWKEKLIEEGYLPKFEGINFDAVKKALLADRVTIGTFLTLQRNGYYRDMEFSNCTYMRKFDDAIFVNCRFNNCVFQDGFINGIMHNCSLESVAFAKGASYTNLQFNKVKMHDCIFEGGMFNGTKFIETQLDHCYFNHMNFSECTFSDSSFENLDLTNTKFDRCRMVNIQVTHMEGLLSSDFYKSEISEGPALEKKPLIVMLYSPSDGTMMANKFIEFLKDKNLNVVLVDPKIGMLHPVFSEPDKISGIVLPGGPNVPADENDTRKKFEINLLTLAIEKKIPTLGICRGHQLIGEYFGAKIQNLDDHEDDVIHVKKKDSQLYKRLERKHAKFEAQRKEGKEGKTQLDKDDKEGFTYISSCAHYQAIFFNKPRDKADKERVKIVARAADKTIEAMEIEKHIVTYQHHHEDMFDEEDKETAKVAKALLKQYVSMVKEYAESKPQDKPVFSPQ